MKLPRISAVLRSPPSRAAWIEIETLTAAKNYTESPPSRAAWIEIITPPAKSVATTPSPPSRAAWIEIDELAEYTVYVNVAAFTGGVD